jgi:signal transduction histidine kinase
VVLLYNAGFVLLSRRVPSLRRDYVALLRFAAAQLWLDLALLAALVGLSGGADSPILGLYAVHMVFAGLLLPSMWSYATAGVAIATLGAGLYAGGHWTAEPAWILRLLGWSATILLVVYLADRIAGTLYRREQARLRKTQRLRRMTALLRAQQAAMIQHEKMAAMGRLAAGVAHEINNPLSSIDSALQLMERNPESPRLATIAALREQVKRIHGTVCELTAFAHPDRGRVEPFPVNEVVGSALHMLGFDHRLRRAQLSVDLAESAGRAMLAQRTVQQVLMNLVLNALDAMAEVPQPILRLATRREGRWCVIEVRDNGCGIGPDRIDRIFEPFYTTKPVGSGTGLGLSISASLVADLSGRITVTSEPNVGTTFTVWLPAVTECEAGPANASPMAGAVAETPRPR